MIVTQESPLGIVWPAKYSEVPKDIFHREDVYQLELERIFYGPIWQPLAHVAELPAPGDFKTSQIGESPVLVVHGADGRIRAFYNVCPHRGTQLQTCNRGSGSTIECPYHRWTFSNEGALLGAPGIDGFPPTFRKEDYGLRELRSEVYSGLVFATCSDETPPLDEYLGETKDYFARALGGGGPLRLIGYQKVVFASNWKAYRDNDGYHAPLLHRAFRMLGWQGGKGIQGVTRYGHKYYDSELRPATRADFLADPTVIEVKDAQGPLRSTIVNIFPMVSITKHLDVINARFAFPRSKDETEVHYAYFARPDDPPEILQHRLHQSSNLFGPSGFVSLEDGAVFNRIQRASKTPGNVEFQKGVRGRIEPPCTVQQNDEASNLVKWERYREMMGFERA